MLGRITGLKYFNVYGPNEWHKGDMRSVVAKSYDQIRAGGGVSLFRSYRPDFADGKQPRDFIYVKDAVKMTLALAANPAATGIFNLGSGESAHVARPRDRRVRRARPAAADRVRRHAGHAAAEVSISDRGPIDRLRDAGFADSLTSLEDGVADYVQRYLVDERHLDPAVPEPSGAGSPAAARER